MLTKVDNNILILHTLFLQPKPSEADEENDDEFLSPESESEQEEQNDEQVKEEKVPKKEKESIEPQGKSAAESNEENLNSNVNDNAKDDKVESNINSEEKPIDPVEDKQDEDATVENAQKLEEDKKPESPPAKAEEEEIKTTESKEETTVSEENDVSEAIEEPVMVVTGEGNGADCESSYIIGEEITEEVMFFYGEGSGYDNDTGNPEAIEQTNSAEDRTDEENGNEECLNGDTHELSNSSSKNKLGKGVKLKSVPTVTKRALKKQSNDATEVLKSDSKKHCIRNLKRSDSSHSNSKSSEIEKEGSVGNDKSTTDSETPWKNRIKKGRCKVKKKEKVANKQESNDKKEMINSVSETDNGHDSKASIIEKRKSSVSSVEQEEVDADSEKEKSPDKELKAEDPLPPKKLRLDTPESDINEAHSKDSPDNLNNTELKDPLALDDKESLNEVENEPISKRKKIKASKGKFKRKKFIKNSVDKSTDKDASSIRDKKANKSLKRTLLDSTMSDKNKSESHSESEVDEPVSSGKRLKIRPKKIITSSR